MEVEEVATEFDMDGVCEDALTGVLLVLELVTDSSLVEVVVDAAAVAPPPTKFRISVTARATGASCRGRAEASTLSGGASSSLSSCCVVSEAVGFLRRRRGVSDAKKIADEGARRRYGCCDAKKTPAGATKACATHTRERRTNTLILVSSNMLKKCSRMKEDYGMVLDMNLDKVGS